jgi:hypothetical protein
MRPPFNTKRENAHNTPHQGPILETPLLLRGSVLAVRARLMCWGGRMGAKGDDVMVPSSMATD